ncbi:hypothetical protein M5D96_004009, partial [Drosophila gunungcola]
LVFCSVYSHSAINLLRHKTPTETDPKKVKKRVFRVHLFKYITVWICLRKPQFPKWQTTQQLVPQRENCRGRRPLNALIIFELYGFKCLCAVAKAATALEITLSSFWGIKPLSSVAVLVPSLSGYLEF